MKMAGFQSGWLMLTAFLTCVPFGGSVSISESKLARFLLNSSRYSTDVRPVRKYEDKLIVCHGLSLAQLIKLDEKNQIITTRVLVKVRWDDFLLTWNPSDYDGITEINVDVSLIWIPQIQLFNNADDSLDTIAVPRAIVRYNGTVTALFPRILKSTCEINVRDFPFDHQICDLKFGSYQFDTEQMDVRPLSDKVKSHMGIAKYEENGEWDLIDERVDQGTVCHAFSNNTVFSQLSYKLLLRRKPLYYIANFIIPCVLIALVTILLFLIPPDTGEQMAVGVTILLSMAVFFLLLEDKMPETSDVVPLLGKYFACTIVQISLAVGATCMMLRFHHHDATDVPNWMKKYILIKLAWLLRIKTSEHFFFGGGRRGTVMVRLRKSTKTGRRTDSFVTEIARNNLLIWQAKARAKRLRREKTEEDHVNSEDIPVTESNKKVLEGVSKVTDPKKKSREETAILVSLQAQNENNIRQTEEKKAKLLKVKPESTEQLIEKDSRVKNDENKQNRNKGTLDEKMLESEKKSKKREQESMVSDAKIVEKEENRAKEKVETRTGDENKVQKNSSSTVSKGREESFNGKGDGSRQQTKKSERDRKQRKGAQEKQNEKKKTENHEKAGVKGVGGKKDAREKIEIKADKDKVEIEESKRKTNEAIQDSGETTSKETKTQKATEDRERKRTKSDPKRKKQSGTESKMNDDLKEERKKMADGRPKEKDRRQSKSREEDTSTEKSKVGTRNEQKVPIQKGNDDKIDAFQSEHKTEKKLEKSKWRGDGVVKVGAWVKLEPQDEGKKNKQSREEEKKEVEKKKEEVKKASMKSTGNSERKVEEQVMDAQNLEIYDMEDIVSDENRKIEKHDTLESERKKDANVKLTPVEYFDNTQSAENEAGSTTSIRSCDEDTRILMSPSRRSKLTKRPAGKQFKIVDRVLRIKESLTQRLQSSNAENKQEPIGPPQETALQRSAKKIENAANWAEAEHESVKLMAHNIQETEIADQLKGKWKEVGRVLNNLLMWMYIVSILFAFFVFFGPIFVDSKNKI